MADYDVLIIGAGGGGPVVAKELAEQGLRVLQLEAGPYHRDPERAWTHSEADMNNVVGGTLRWGPSDRFRSPWVRRVVDAGLVQQIAGVGGTTLHYFGNSPRAYPLAVERGGWPMPYDDLVPYYERVETLLPVIRDPRLPTKDAWFLHGAARFGLPEIPGRDVRSAGWRPQYNAILPPGYAGPGRSLGAPGTGGCNQCGHCYEGCMHPHGVPLDQQAKRSTNVSYVPLAEAHQNYRLETDAFATRILTGTRGGETVATGVRWRNTRSGEISEATAEVVVLSAGCVESPRLWLNSELPDANDTVGRYLTIHWFDFVTGTFDHPIHPYVGQNSQSRVDVPGLGCLETVGLGPGKFGFGTSTFSDQWGSDDNSRGEPWDTRGHLTGQQFEQMLSGYDRSLPVLVITDDEISRENRVTLDPAWPADEHGRVPLLAYRPTPESDRRRDELARMAADILRAAGARRVQRASWPPLYLHMQSSMRRGRDPRTSVVDAWGEAWEVKRLYLADASSLPDSLGGPNPTLSLQMFATQTAERIAVEHFGRAPFVKEGLGRTTPAGFAPPPRTSGGATGVPFDATAGSRGRALPATGAGPLAAGAAATTAAGAVLYQISRPPSARPADG
ncbi:MAG: GMC family oxidoreductase [Mycobacteriales bacterium]